MKTLVMYSSVSGNTKKIADTMVYEMDDYEIINSKDFRTSMIPNFDVFCIGYWVDKGDCDAQSLQVLRHMSSERIALFGTLGAAENTAYYQSIKQRVEQHLPDATILGHFLCQGKINDALLERYREQLKKDPDNIHMKAQLENYEQGKTHPDEHDLALAKSFAEEFG